MLNISDEAFNSYYDVDKETSALQANAGVQGAARRLRGPWHPQVMLSLPARLLLKGGPRGGHGVMPFAGSSAPLCRVWECPGHGWGPTGGTPEQQEGWTYKTAVWE